MGYLSMWRGAGRRGLPPCAFVLGLWTVGCASNGDVNGESLDGSTSGHLGVSSSSSGSGASSGSDRRGQTSSSSGSSSGSSGSSSSGGSGSSSSGGSGSSGAGDDGGTGTGGMNGEGGSPPPTGNIPHCAALDGITNYGMDGPFMVKPAVMGSVNFWVPSVPAGCKVPVIHLSNGTGATCSAYQPALNRMATHGFLATCYENPNTGAGAFGLQALEAALMAYPDLADMKFGSTGHSQGGQAAFTCLQLAEAKYGSMMIYAGLAMEPASGFGVQPTGGTWQMIYAEIKSPMFMFSGLGTDGLVSQAWVQQAYDATSKSEEAYFWTASGATHIPVPNGEEEEISIPWFRWKLLGDSKACQFFKNIPKTDTKWAQVASKNEAPCQ